MTEVRQEPNLDPPKPLEEGLDYYLEKGYWVFTEHYLRRRGYCCGNGCRHCPYGRDKTKIETPPIPR